jgi:hypothetical protein
MSVVEENEALSNRVAQAINRGDLDAFDELMSPELAQESKREIADLRRAFPDFHGINEIQIAEGDFRTVLTDLHRRYDEIEGTGPHAMYARVKVAEQVRRLARDLVALYGVVLPETDGEKIVLDRLMKMAEAPLPEGFPEVGEQTAVERHLEEMEAELSEYGFTSWEDVLSDDRGGGY